MYENEIREMRAAGKVPQKDNTCVAEESVDFDKKIENIQTEIFKNKKILVRTIDTLKTITNELYENYSAVLNNLTLVEFMVATNITRFGLNYIIENYFEAQQRVFNLNKDKEATEKEFNDVINTMKKLCDDWHQLENDKAKAKKAMKKEKGDKKRSQKRETIVINGKIFVEYK